MKFKRNTSGDLVAENYQIKNIRRKLSQSTIIENQRIKVYNAWQEDNKNEFEFSNM